MYTITITLVNGNIGSSWADPVLGKLGACLRYKISDILELLMRCSFTVKL